MTEERPLERGELYPGTFVDARTQRPAGLRMRRRLMSLLRSRAEHEEMVLEGRLRAPDTLARPTVLATLSPKGGVGKTTLSYLVGALIAERLRLRVLVVDADPDGGTLAGLAPDSMRSDRTWAHLLEDPAAVLNSTKMRQFVSVLPSGLHLLGRPRGADAKRLADDAGALSNVVVATQVFYELVILDLGKGTENAIAQLAIDTADQFLVVTTPELASANLALETLSRLGDKSRTVVINKVDEDGAVDVAVLRKRLAAAASVGAIELPYDRHLKTMLSLGTYSFRHLERDTRMPIREVAVSVAQALP